MREKPARPRIPMPRINVPGIGLTIRLGLALAAVGLSVIDQNIFLVTPWALSIAAADVLIVVLRHWRRGLGTAYEVIAVLGLSALAAMSVQVGPGIGTSTLLLVAAIHAGLALGRVGALLTGFGILATSVFMVELTSHHDLASWGLLIVTGLMMVVALIASLWRVESNDEDEDAAEARELLLRLATLADSLDTGFDIPALGDAALEEIAEDVTIDRAALILRTGNDAVPVALRGHTRMPWPAPTDQDSPLSRTWADSVTFHWMHTEDGRRNYGLTVPLFDGRGSPAGMIALDRRHGPFSLGDQAAVEDVARRTSPILDVGVLFSQLRGRAALEERSRLARDMHDGVAQELAALSFQADMLLQQSEIGTPIHMGLESLRNSMRQALDDIRHQISTLRMVERPGVSLGAILSSTLQLFATHTGVRTTMTMSETMFRFPAHIEVQLHRLALDFLADARSCGASAIDWEVSLSSPNARLILKHDGVSSLTHKSFDGHPVKRHGEVVVDSLLPHGLYVEATIGTDTGPQDHRPLSEQLEHLTLAGDSAVISNP